MTLATATIERFTTALTDLAPVTETPVTRNPTVAESGNSDYAFLLYVTGSEQETTANRARYNTVVRVMASPSQAGWLHKVNGSDWEIVRLYGAPLNPVMVNGHYYRTLNHRNMVARYNDEDHRAGRNVPNLPLSMIAGDGTPWPFPNDGMSMWADDIPYIEVEAPALTPADPPAAAEEPTDAHQFVEDTSVDGPTFGFAQAEDDGRVRLNPDLEAGQMYLFWSPGLARGANSMTEARLVLAAATEDEPAQFAHIGYWTSERVSGGLVPYFYSNRRTVLDSATEKAWAKLALAASTEPTVTDTDRFTTLLTTEQSEFREFNDATNTLAEDNDWCSEYEDIVTTVGMEGRTKKVNDYYVTVSADFSFYADSVSSNMDREIANSYDVPGFSGTSATLTGSATVDIFVSERTDEDDAGECIDSSMVEEALENMMSNASDIDVSDWSITSTRLAD